jgi:hypothetical protein
MICEFCNKDMGRIDEHICGVTVRRTDDAVYDLPGEKCQAKDNLEGVFELQQKFMELLGVPKLDMPRSTTLPISDFIKMLTTYSQTCTTAINCEVTELLDALPWKPWKKSYVEVDLNNISIEIVDIFHFVIELAIIWGLDSKTLFNIYSKKMQENIDRQKKRY